LEPAARAIEASAALCSSADIGVAGEPGAVELAYQLADHLRPGRASCRSGHFHYAPKVTVSHRYAACREGTKAGIREHGVEVCLVPP
jgi:hypothetical protein